MNALVAFGEAFGEKVCPNYLAFARIPENLASEVLQVRSGDFPKLAEFQPMDWLVAQLQFHYRARPMERALAAWRIQIVLRKCPFAYRTLM